MRGMKRNREIDGKIKRAWKGKTGKKKKEICTHRYQEK